MTGLTRRARMPKRPNKAASPARVTSWRIPAWWLTEYFGPLELFAEQLELDGTMNVSERGIPLLLLQGGGLYYPLAEMWAMAEVFRIARLRDASCPSGEVLLRVATKLNVGQLLTLDEVMQLRRRLQDLRAFAASQSRNGMIDLIRTVCIKVEMAKREVKSVDFMQHRTD